LKFFRISEDDDDERFRGFVTNGGDSLQEMMMAELGDSYDEILLLAMVVALETAILKGEYIDISMMIGRHLEWQEANA